jgi:hypothetical protein
VPPLGRELESAEQAHRFHVGQTIHASFLDVLFDELEHREQPILRRQLDAALVVVAEAHVLADEQRSTVERDFAHQRP